MHSGNRLGTSCQYKSATQASYQVHSILVINSTPQLSFQARSTIKQHRKAWVEGSPVDSLSPGYFQLINVACFLGKGQPVGSCLQQIIKQFLVTRINHHGSFHHKAQLGQVHSYQLQHTHLDIRTTHHMRASLTPGKVGRGCTIHPLIQAQDSHHTGRGVRKRAVMKEENKRLQLFNRLKEPKEKREQGQSKYTPREKKVRVMMTQKREREEGITCVQTYTQRHNPLYRCHL